MASSSMLLLLIPETEKNSAITPGKVFEYIATGKNVLYIGPVDGDAAFHLKKCGQKGIFDGRNIALISDYISASVQANRSSEWLSFPEYSRKNLTSEISRVLDAGSKSFGANIEPKNILMILDGEFPPDERVEKEAVSLIREGNNVTILCLNYGKQPQEEVYKGIHISRIKINKTFRNKLLGTFLVTPFYRLLWKREILKLNKTFKSDVFHVHDLPLSDVAAAIARKTGSRLVFDQHEFYSNWIVNTAHYNTVAGKIVKRLSNWKKYEKKNLLKADIVITVEEPLRKIYIEETGIDPGKIIILPNTPSSAIFDHTKTDHTLAEKYKNNFVIFYAGHIDILRGINTIIEALPLLRDSVPGIKFVFAGHFTGKYYDPLSYIEKLGVSDLAEYLGFIKLSELPSYIAASDVCIHVPPAISLEVNSSVATKIYQYILMRKPIIVGQARMMKELVENNRLGLSIKESDPADLAEKVKLLYSSPALLKEFSENADRIAAKFTWEETSKPFIEHYKKLIS
jgi:glycosyltransferase involved in cell wall biosynthesis